MDKLDTALSVKGWINQHGVVIEGGQPQDFTGFGCVRVRFR